MNKELSDRVWKMLPKEFKKEVKRMWSVEVDCATKYKSELHKHRTDLLYELFGEHLHWQNDFTSDAEGEEEMLCVKAKTIHEMYAANQRIMKDFRGSIDGINADLINHILRQLFGSKCLPDETCNVASKEPNPAEGYDVFNDPEPKCLHFKDGKCAHPAVAHLENGKLVKGADCDVSSCEDVEYEPKPSELKEEADEHFDTIVKGGFRNERRLNIAAQITASIYANDKAASRFDSMEALVRKALDIADTLIAECKKGGNHD